MPLCLGQLSCTPETRVSHLSLSYEHSKVPGGWRLRWLLGLRLQEILSVWSLKSFLSSKWEQLLSPTDVGQCVTTLLPCRPRAAASPPHLHPPTRLPAPHRPTLPSRLRSGLIEARTSDLMWSPPPFNPHGTCLNHLEMWLHLRWNRNAANTTITCQELQNLKGDKSVSDFTW